MISMKFSKTKEPSKVLKDSKLRDDSPDEDEETDFVTSIYKTQIHGTKKKEKVEDLAIPLIPQQKNEGLINMGPDYDKIPIDEFGVAMLRGMGWSKNEQHVEILEPQLRPKRLGLGASVNSKGVQNSTASGSDKKEVEFKIGAGARIERGSDKGMDGKIEAFDEDNSRVVIKLAISGKLDTVSKFHDISKRFRV